MIKVMFLVAVDKDRMELKKVKFFDGKLGFFPLIEEVESKRNRKIE